MLLYSLCMIWAAIWQHLDIIFHVCDVITKRNDTSSDSSLFSETKRTVRVKPYVRDWRTPSPDRCLRSQCKQPSAARSSLEKRKCGLVVYCACYWDNNFKLKIIVHPKIYICLKMISPLRPSKMWWGCFFIRTDLGKFSIISLAHQWILCSEWVPSAWESKQLIKTSQ